MTSEPDWKAVAILLADALEAVQEGWLYLRGSDSKEASDALRAKASEKFIEGLDKRKIALAAFEKAKNGT